MLGMVACGEAPLENGRGAGSGLRDPMFELTCDLPESAIFDGGVARDAIPALVNPPLVPADHPDAAYLAEYAALRAEIPEYPDLRVVGLVTSSGAAVAIPHNILWWHEIVHIDDGGRRLAVTYCPLTASAVVFDATAAGTRRFGVSGLIARNNLMMFDPETESLWSQMSLRASCGPRRGHRLRVLPSIEMGWDAWKARHPDTRVVSSATGVDRNYAAYPYDLYEAAPAFLLFPMDQPLDERREAKERVLGIPDGSGGVAFPFGELEARGEHAVAHATVGGRPVVVLWDAVARAAGAYEPRSAEGPATLSVRQDVVMDAESGSQWDVEGRAVQGPRAGETLERVPEAFVAFWFAWAAFYPETVLWSP